MIAVVVLWREKYRSANRASLASDCSNAVGCIGIQGRRSREASGFRPEQVPSIPLEIEEHGNPPVRLGARLAHEPHARVRQSRMAGIEVFHAQEEADTTGELPTDRLRLRFTVRAREPLACRRSRRTNNDPPLGATVVRAGRRILDEVKAEHSDKEVDRRVVLPHDEGNELEMRQGTLRSGTSERGARSRRTVRLCCGHSIKCGGAAAASIS